MYKLLITDLDGSIIDESEKISHKNLEAVKILKRNGIKITIATGRRWASTSRIISPLEINLPIILYNGAGIYDPISAKFIFIKYLSKVAIHKFLKMLNEYLSYVKVGIYWEDRLLENREALGLIKEYRDGIIKIFLEGEKEILDKLKMKMDNYEDLFTIVFSSPKYLEILPPNTSKGRALIKLIEILNLKREEIIALGDYNNDEDMLKVSGLKVTLESGAKELREIADYILKTSPQESLYELVYNVLKLERR